MTDPLGLLLTGRILIKYNKCSIFSSVAKKILFIITQSEFGGAQRLLSTFATKLDLSKYEILVATGSTGDRNFTEHLSNNRIQNTVLPSLVRDISLLNDIRAVGEIRKLIGEFQPEVLFLLSTKAGFLGSYAARNSKIKIIYRIGGWAFNDPQLFFRRWILILAERISARWKDVIILNNRHDFEQARRLNIRPRKSLEMIHNGLDIYKMDFFGKDEARKKLNLPMEPRTLIVGTIANFYPSKGLEYFVEAAKTFVNDPRILFVIVGGGKHKPSESPNVILAGRIPEASRALPAFDIFVSSSVKEGFQWSVLEAMSAKLPVIATKVGAVPELIENGKNGFIVEPKKPERIVDCLHQLIADEHLRQEFGIQAHQTVLHGFDIELMMRGVENLL